MKKGIKIFNLVLTFALLLVITISNTKVGAKEYTIPDGVGYLNIENVDQVYSDFDLYNGRITWQAIAIPKNYVYNSYLESIEFTNVLNVDQFSVDLGANYTSGALAYSFLNSSGEFVVENLHYLQPSWSINKQVSTSQVTYDPMNVNNWTVLNLRASTIAGQRIYLLPLTKLLGQVTFTDKGFGYSQNDYQLALLIDEEHLTRELVVINNNAVISNDYYYNHLNYQSLTNNDADYYYIPTTFNFNTDYIDYEVQYANNISENFKEFVVENLGQSEEMIANHLQIMQNLFPDVKFAFKYEKLGDTSATYQDGYNLGWNTGYNQGVQDTSGKTFEELGWYNWIVGIFTTMGMFLELKIGNISIGYFVLIPLVINVVTFIIKIWKGGQGD